MSAPNATTAAQFMIDTQRLRAPQQSTWRYSQVSSAVFNTSIKNQRTGKTPAQAQSLPTNHQVAVPWQKLVNFLLAFHSTLSESPEYKSTPAVQNSTMDQVYYTRVTEEIKSRLGKTLGYLI